MATNRLPAVSRTRHDNSTINLEIGARSQTACCSTLTFGVEMKFFTFTDNLEIVEGPISVDAEISMVPTSEGGRHGPFSNGFRPNHNFGDEDNRAFFIGQIEVEPDELVYPGDTKNLSVTFLGSDGLRELLTHDRIWRIQEGPKLVGTGRVLSVSPQTPAPNKAS